jgi:hypothetical protein
MTLTRSIINWLLRSLSSKAISLLGQALRFGGKNWHLSALSNTSSNYLSFPSFAALSHTCWASNISRFTFSQENLECHFVRNLLYACFILSSPECPICSQNHWNFMLMRLFERESRLKVFWLVVLENDFPSFPLPSRSRSDHLFGVEWVCLLCLRRVFVSISTRQRLALSNQSSKKVC